MRRIVLAIHFLLAGSALTAQDSQTFDHSIFDGLLRDHVSPEGLVDYDGFAGDPDFQRYLELLAEARPASLSEADRLALWINAYNAYTIQLINHHGERKSIRNINKTLGLFSGKGPWKERLAKVAGKVWTLDEIEHEIIRKRFSEPRIHFALVCAALGCPPLRSEAYLGEELEAQLDDQAKRFLTESPLKNRVDRDERVVHLSRIIDWYRDDFPPGSEGLGRFLAEFHPPGPERDLLESGRFDVKYTDYDWSLNGSGGS
ncbi:MAG: DUF547 domain-containing protein [Gemmatimonadetes bacterium]|nr:DUF547 domain-containing protein [Gemmatimonadota bacterium]